MSKAKSGDKVKVHYTGKTTDGREFDSSRAGDPLEFTIGKGQVITGFEEAILGMEEGENKTVTVSKEEAYGPHKENLVVTVEKSRFPKTVDPKIGEQLQVPQDQGNPIIVTVTEIQDNDVTLDANHPLAGRDLVFDIELVEIT